jgi:copper transport outer membrane protein MctB
MLGARYHVMAIVAALAALLTGIVVGAGPLAAGAHTRLEDQKGRLRSDEVALRSELTRLKQKSAREGSLTRAAAVPLVHGQLPKRSVVILALPGATDAAVAGARKALEAAGATVVQTLQLTPTYFDPKNAKSPLEDLALRLVPPEVEFLDGATPIDRVSTVLARATVTTQQDDAATVEQPAAEVLAGLQELGAVRTIDGEPGRRAELAVVVAPPGPVASGTARKAATQAVVGLAAALDRAARGAVVTGPGSAASGAGALAALRSPALADVSTVDLADTEAGGFALVMAVREQLRGGAGSYGDGRGATALLPDFVDPPK